MKKTTLFWALVLGSVILFSSCFSTPKFNVGDISADQGATVNFIGWVIIKKWNNIDIYDDLYDDKSIWSSNGKTQLTVPPGNNSFVFDIIFFLGRDAYKYTNIELQYNLLPGRKYDVGNTAKSLGFGRVALSIEIYDVTNEKELLKEWKLRDDSQTR
ncbi:MAG: hypothetical protein LBI28_11330 [Treponema sp.]|jgi:hypothetical protein|nr:hypothetical protein [Treponema sp.]